MMFKHAHGYIDRQKYAKFQSLTTMFSNHKALDVSAIKVSYTFKNMISKKNQPDLLV